MAQALAQARLARPTFDAEARLLAGLAWWVRTAATGTIAPDAVTLRPEGPVWASVLAAVAATAALCGEGTRRLLAPWTGGVVGGVGRTAGEGAGFPAGQVDGLDGPGPER